MRLSRAVSLAALPAMALVLLAACGPAPDDPTLDPAGDRTEWGELDQDRTGIEPARPAPEAPAAEYDEVVRGELGRVDLENNLFTVMADGIEHEFTFSDETEVLGVATGPQGLAGREGDWVAVYYREGLEPDAKRAVRIELDEAGSVSSPPV